MYTELLMYMGTIDVYGTMDVYVDGTLEFHILYETKKKNSIKFFAFSSKFA